MKRLIALGTVLFLGGLSVAVMGYQGPPPGRGPGGPGAGPGAGAPRGAAAPQGLTQFKVRDNLYMLAGAGGNTAVFIMSNGVTLVDTKNPNTGQAILDQVKMLTPKPVTQIINTHTHADHTGSNEFFAGNITFVAHENTKANMVKMTNFAGDKAKFLPSKTFTDKMTLGSGADQIDLYYFGRAHTNGDAFVVFPALRAMHSGDAFATKGFPNVDAANGGSVMEYGKTLAKAASTIKNVDTIINGHITTGPTQFSDLQVYADFNSDIAKFVEDAIKASKTADQASTEYKLPEKFTAAGYTMPAAGGRGGPANMIRAAYTELGK